MVLGRASATVENRTGWTLWMCAALSWLIGLHEIPLESRILAVADSYEAMTADRPVPEWNVAADGAAGARPLRRIAIRPGGRPGLPRRARPHASRIGRAWMSSRRRRFRLKG
jgi:hypothetical protein